MDTSTNNEVMMKEMIQSLHIAIHSIMNDTQTIKELTSLRDLLSTSSSIISSSTADKKNKDENNNSSSSSSQTQMKMIALLATSQLTQIESILSTLETKVTSLSNTIQNEKESMRKLVDTTNIANEQYEIIQCIIDDCLHDNDDPHEDEKDDDDVNENDNAKNNKELKRKKHTKVPLWEALPGIDDYLFLKKMQMEENESVNDNNNNLHDTTFDNVSGCSRSTYTRDDDGNRESTHSMNPDLKVFNENNSVIIDNESVLQEQEEQEKLDSVRRRRRRSSNTWNNNSVLRDQTNTTSASANTTNHHPSRKSNSSSTTNNGFVRSIHLKAVTMNEYQKVSKNIRGRISLSSINAALDDIQSSIEQKYYVLSNHHYHHQKQQKGHHNGNTHTTATPTTTAINRSYRETLSIHQNHVSSIEESIASLLSSNKTNEEGEEEDHYQPCYYFISEQELRSDCLFFHKGESTARAILLILRSVKRIKQVVGKHAQNCYVVMV